MRRRTTRRNEKGASLFLIAMAAFILCYLIYLGFQYCMLQGGSREVRNGVDAAVLNLSKRVCEVKVNPSPSYADCADTSGQVSMANINRVWGKAYLINANVDEMKQEGLVTGDATTAGDMAYQMAEQVNNDLRDNVTSKCTLDALFSHLGNQRNVPLLGASGIRTSTEVSYPIALVDRGAESNLNFNPTGLPKAANPPRVSMGDKNFVSGYSTFMANSKPFCFTPFRIGETPHLIADSDFNKNRADSHPLPDFAMAIPNAYQGTGTAFGSGTSLAAAASAVVNPMRQYTMAIPHSFIRIVFTAISNWTIDDKVVTKGLPYNADSGKVAGIKNYKLKGGQRVLNGWANLGLELKRPSLYQVINAVPGNHAPAYDRLVQRAQEIDPDFTLGRLTALLEKLKPDPSSTDYYVFPRYTTEDLTDPVIDIQPGGKSLPGWLQKIAPAEGSSKDIVKEQVFEDHENTFVYIIGGNPDCLKWLEITGTLRWVPGTGQDQCLGNLFVSRVTTVKYKPGTEN